MIDLARNEYRMTWTAAAAAHPSLTVSWTEQLLRETERAVRQAVTEEELPRAIWVLAKLTYVCMQGLHIAQLWSMDEKTVAQELADLLALPGDLSEQLRALSRAEEEASAEDGTYPGVPTTRELRRLAVRFIQCARHSKPAGSILQ